MSKVIQCLTRLAMGEHMLAVTLVFCLLLGATPAKTQERIIIADFSAGVDAKSMPVGWQLNEFSGKADFTLVKDGDLHAIRLRSESTSFSLQKEVQVDVKHYPVLSWKWKVTKMPTGGDFRESDTDDQAAQLFVGFSNTKFIVYIWDTSAPQGRTGDSPASSFMPIKIVVVRSGNADAGKWLTETRNVYEDYKKLYGEEPSTVGGIRIQINSQHTGTSAESYFADAFFQTQ